MTATQTISIRPQPGRQEQFLSSPADIVIYGGAAGGGKTWALLLDPIRNIRVGDFNAAIFRRTYPEVTNLGGLWDESEKIYPYAGGTGLKGDLVWRFRDGSRIEFNHCQYEADLLKYDGAQICVLEFDQLEHFTEKQFFYLAARNRSTCGIRPRIRASCNPPDPADPGAIWLTKLIGWWIADDGYANLERAGQVRWMVRWNEQIEWADTADELLQLYPQLQPQSVTFIPATVYDNQILMREDPNYIARLQALPMIERMRFLGDKLRGGNWKVVAGAGKVFNRDWFQLVNAIPDGGVECRAWDLAATLKSVKNDDPDYTSGVKIRKVQGVYYVTDMFMDRVAAGEIDNVMRHVADRDVQISRASLTRYKLRWETEPGSAGIRETTRLTQWLHKEIPGLDCDGIPSTGDKLQRARSFSAAAEQGKVRILAAPWTDTFLAHMHGFPDYPHDDPVDASSLGYNTLESLLDAPVRQPANADNPWLKLRNI